MDRLRSLRMVLYMVWIDLGIWRKHGFRVWVYESQITWTHFERGVLGRY